MTIRRRTLTNQYTARRPLMGPTSGTRMPHAYVDAELPLTLQDHAHPVHYRNVWIRKLAGYGQPEQK
jgi:hypothetical protein